MDLCSICYNELIKLSGSIKNDKGVYKIDEHHCYMIGKYGPAIRKDVDGETSFINVKKDLDIDKLKIISIAKDIIEKKFKYNFRKYKNNDVILKKGKFGLYVTCNGNNYSIKHVKKKMDKIKLSDVLEVFNKKNSNMLMELNNDLSIRKGKYGAYIFYKTEKMNKPRFLKIKDLNWNKMEKNEILDWISNIYNI